MKDKKKVNIYYGLLIILIIFAGVSYAWFRLTKTQENKNVIGTRSCLDATLTEETSKIVLDDAFPISDEDGMKQTPFTFTLKNNCEGYVKVYITIDSKYRGSTSDDYLKDDYVKANLSTKGTTTGQSTLLANDQLIDLENNNKGYILVSTGLKANEEKSYDLRVWVDSETTLEQGLNKSWEGKIVVVGEAASGKNLSDIILADNEIKEPLTVPGKEVSAHVLDDITSITTNVVGESIKSSYVTYGTGWEATNDIFRLTGATVTTNTYANSYSDLVGKYILSNVLDAGITSSGKVKATESSMISYVVSATSESITLKVLSSNKNETESVLASTEDDYGTSYYFRGTVKNNHVQFANKCWRIVRIIGDGSVKLVLNNDNISGVSNPCSSANNSAESAFAHFNDSTFQSIFNNNNDDNAYIGLMYGGTGKNDYASSHANTNKSIILTNLETWYTDNLASYEDKLADTIWCNDKSTSSGAGYGTITTNYGAYGRLLTSKEPTLVCSKDNSNGRLSKFTVNDTANGNGNLTYKIGLLTADEVAFSGSAVFMINGASYLRENVGENSWWTISPASYSEAYSGMFRVGEGSLYVSKTSVLNAIRPAIALKSNVEISGGTGTSEDPYVVN